VHSRYTHRSSALPVGPRGVFKPSLWPLKAPGCTLGEGRQASRQPSDASTPRSKDKWKYKKSCQQERECSSCLDTSTGWIHENLALTTSHRTQWRKFITIPNDPYLSKRKRNFCMLSYLSYIYCFSLVLTATFQVDVG